MLAFLRSVFGGQGSWVRRFEHPALRLVSFVFSVGSAYAFASFFAPLDVNDPVHRVITLAISVALGLLGYFLSRGLTHRFMEKEPVWAIIPLFIVVEFLEIFTNYAQAAPAIHATVWLSTVSPEQYTFDVVCTYLVYCCIPLVGPFLAVLDMDLERRGLKQAPVVSPVAPRSSSSVQVRPPQQSVKPPVQPVSSVPPRASQPQRPGAGNLSNAPRPSSGTAPRAASNPPPGVTRQPPQLQPELEPV